MHGRPVKQRRVVVTGMGIVSCLGLSRREVQAALKAGTPGIALLPERKELGFQSGLSGVIDGFVPRYPLDRKYRSKLPEFGWWTWDALCQALEQAGVEAAELAGETRTGFLFGNDSSVVTGVEQCEMLKAAGETRGIGSGHIFRLLTSTVTLNLCTKLQLRGASWTVSGACASGAMAIGQAAELIAGGRQDRMLCGGGQEISWQSMCSFDAVGAFARREEAPHQASRPFDQGRDGLVPGGGAAMLLLEAEETARARGAEILAEICGYDFAADGYHISVPSGEGMERAMAGAIADAGLEPEQIDLVMAHATSTPVGDEKEAQALCRLFELDRGKPGPLVAATKALTGHEFWMAGASQVIYALLMSRAGFVGPHPNLVEPAPEAAKLRIPTATLAQSPRFILCNAAGFGGVNASLVVQAL
ncbi:beta-ketoacyl-[acyl-carrier-protein] synthase family protein [Desulfurivibrio alkaliphilus]|uniref:3-oxoacyl-[acyl-carrier-protein] synthase 1 n=1 Tax=Desulfurivibrio alkaliphilus (strain DSM 19089 / UNIQEM U267 / AHT2) TaxID=589865 RepID=D6Z2Q9_DESAT|nr:beta-ketoacyl-[acyl-carrier-protein] synthase family protein [Desulfurivibrio alkaliphilus]ADH85834.1 Beta-ketoacyl synthase [Desulfurivibrio alkaliphilus AHT 2]